MRRGVGKTQRGIFDMLAADEDAAVTVRHLASKLGVSEEAISASARRLARRGMVVFWRNGTYVWLPERRRSGLRTGL